jgi:hypothetical protein
MRHHSPCPPRGFLSDCFLSAPAGANIAPIQRALEAAGYSTEWASPLQHAESLAHYTRRLIAEADLFVGLVSGPSMARNANVLLEAGIALALNKRVIFLMKDDSALPSTIAAVPVIRLRPESDVEEVLKLHLRNLKHQSPKISPPRPEATTPAVPARKEEEWRLKLEGLPRRDNNSVGRELESLVLDALSSSGVRILEGSGEDGPDCVAWFDDLEASQLNPVAIEIKVGINVNRRIRDATAYLKRIMVDRQAPVGLIIVDSLQRPELPAPTVPDRELPIFCLTPQKFLFLVQNRQLAGWLLEQRNAWAHGRST